MGLLDSLLSTAQKQSEIVGIALTPEIGLEVAVVDASAGVVKNYGRMPVGYDISRREISDIGQFKNALSELLNRMEILTTASNVAYLALPNVYFDFLELAGNVLKEEVKTAILSEAEEFFVFRRDEPISAFHEVYNPSSIEKKKYVYSSFQKEQVESIVAAVEDCGLKLIGIETNYSAILRGLYAAGMIDDVVMENSRWSVILVNTNSFVIFKMEGKELIGHLEIPLAVRTYSFEGSYDIIVTNVAQVLDDYQSERLFVISQVNEISADIIKRKMRFNNEIVVVESNEYGKANQLMDVKAALDFNDVNSMTLAVIGAATLSPDFNLVLNVLSDDVNSIFGVYFTAEIFGRKVNVTERFVKAGSIVSGAVMAAVFGLLWFALVVLGGSFSRAVTNIDKEIKNVDAQYTEASKEGSQKEIDMNIEIDNIAKMNVTAIGFYDSIATDIPKNVWLTAYYNKKGTQIAVRGIAESIADVYEYYKNLRVIAPQSDIKLSELKVFTNGTPRSLGDDDDKKEKNAGKTKPNDATANLVVNDEDRLYTFEISNTQINAGIEPQRNENEIISKTPVDTGSNEEKVEEVSQQMKPIKKLRSKIRRVTAE